MAALDFSKLVRQPDTFTAADGQVHQVRASTDMGALELARINHLKAEFDTALATLGANPQDLEAAGRVERAINGVIQVILPTVPPETIAGFTLGQKAAISAWWREQEDARGKATAKPDASTSAPSSPA